MCWRLLGIRRLLRLLRWLLLGLRQVRLLRLGPWLLWLQVRLFPLLRLLHRLLRRLLRQLLCCMLLCWLCSAAWAAALGRPTCNLHGRVCCCLCLRSWLHTVSYSHLNTACHWLAWWPSCLIGSWPCLGVASLRRSRWL